MSRPIISVENLSKAYRIGVKEEIPDTMFGAITGMLTAPIRNFRRLRGLDTFGKGVGDQGVGVGDQVSGDSEAQKSSAPDTRHPTPETSSSATRHPTPETSSDLLWALRDVSFDIHEGEVVGIIGRNGAGKSTLLKILSRITEPTSGRVVMRGRVSSLLEVGTGFHPELSGRENIYMNGTILGMRKMEIDRKFDEIVDFSGVEKFLDTPIKRYSSGMCVRLAFAVAAHLEPEILIIDEVLAVGDAEFQKKCLGKMQDVAKGGRTVLFVSHNMPAVRSLTNRGAYLKAGMLHYVGPTEDAIDTYLSDSIKVAAMSGCQSLDYYRRNRLSDSPVYFTRVWTGTDSVVNGHLPVFSPGDAIKISFEVESKLSLGDACISLTIVRNHEQCVTTIFTKDSQFRVPLRVGRQIFSCTIEGLSFSPGTYSLNCGINKNANAIAYDVLIDLPVFEIEMAELKSGALDWPHRPWGAVHWSNVIWQNL